MPVNDPLIGEVWNTEDVAGGRKSATIQAVVADVKPSHVFLLGRNGRIVTVPLKSFNLLWRPIDQPYRSVSCMNLGCNAWACAHTLDDRWFCHQHLPRNAPLLLPGDNASSQRTLIGSFDQCPLCKEKSKMSWQLVHDLLLYSCTCTARWIQLITRGTSSDGLYLGEDLQSAYTILETELCLGIKINIGRQALASLRSMFKEVGNPPRFSGLTLTVDDTFGTSNVLLIGKPPATNVMDGSIRLDSFWAHNTDFTFLRVVAVEDDIRDDREVILSSAFQEGLVARLPENLLKEDYRVIEHLNLTGPASTGVAEPDNVLFERWPVVKNRRKSPLPGEVWWHEYSTGAVQVFGLGVDPHGTDFVRINQGKKSYKMTLKDFLAFNSFGSKDQTGVVIGGEYAEQGDDEDTYIVKSLDNREVLLEAVKARLQRSVRITDFRSSFEQIVRQSAMDILMGDDDLV